MSDDFQNYTLTVAGESKTIRQLLAVNKPEYYEDRTMHSSRSNRWNYTFSVQVDSSITSSADLAESADLIDEEFSYTYGSGSNTIDSAIKNDVINLYGVTLDQIVGAEVSTSAVKLNFDNGNSLTVLGENNNRYVMDDNSTWTVNQNTQTWSQIS